jgi:hypothetical protein
MTHRGYYVRVPQQPKRAHSQADKLVRIAAFIIAWGFISIMVAAWLLH